MRCRASRTTSSRSRRQPDRRAGGGCPSSPGRVGAALPYALILPSILFLLSLYLVPIVQTAVLAFQADAGWSLANWRRMSDDLNFSDAVVNTFSVVIIVVPLQCILALAM